MIKNQRVVKLNDINKSKLGGGHYTIYGYTKQDLAILFGVSIQSIRNMITSKLIDPMSLESIIKLWIERHHTYE